MKYKIIVRKKIKTVDYFNEAIFNVNAISKEEAKSKVLAAIKKDSTIDLTKLSWFPVDNTEEISRPKTTIVECSLIEEDKEENNLTSYNDNLETSRERESDEKGESM